eukprot:CAMPEP_0172602042 /NCGR_PEP_ID=MMETSP1068-20121228/22240_1 /TAXON_ID=35684 /ORGANISM="Pseudopedinella elastica, Strain CCMP716" /LENGTH=660 /DNA_ID=CAMNT_0013403277 /DNA_START=1 /DNA_END=1983 /DNA_ORIENTATION=+
MENLPEFATATGDHRYDDRLDDRSLEAYASRIAWAELVRGRLEAWKQRFTLANRSGSASSEARVTARLLEHHCRCVCEGGEFKTWLAPLNRLEGPHTELPQLVNYMRFETAQDYCKYVARLEASPRAVKQVEELLREGIRAKILPPLVGLEGVAAQLSSVEAGLALGRTGPMWRPCPVATEAAEAAGLEERALKALTVDLRKAFAELRKFVVDVYIPAVRKIRGDSVACLDLPSGAALYSACLAFHTGSKRYTAESVHALGLEEVSRISLELRLALEACGLQKGASQAESKRFLEELKVDPKHQSKTPQEHVAKYRDLCMQILPRLPRLFSIRCMPRTPFAVVETPKAQAEAAPAAYYLGGAGDGTRPGTFFVNTSKLEERPFYEAEALALHEAVPGHHTQTMIAAEAESLPEFRRFMDDRRYSEAPGRYPIDGAFIEGWGLYSESLGKELGLYKDPYQLVGRLSAELFRAARLVVDTGLHTKGWAVKQAIEYMCSNTAASAANVEAEVKRYCVWPGQATGYKIGELELWRLRRRFECSGLGRSGAGLRAFHDLVLLNGSLPLGLVEELIEDAIKAHDDENAASTKKQDSEARTRANTRGGGGGGGNGQGSTGQCTGWQLKWDTSPQAAKVGFAAGLAAAAALLASGALIGAPHWLKRRA